MAKALVGHLNRDRGLPNRIAAENALFGKGASEAMNATIMAGLGRLLLGQHTRQTQCLTNSLRERTSSSQDPTAPGWVRSTCGGWVRA